jgi:hypothetical protein
MDKHGYEGGRHRIIGSKREVLRGKMEKTRGGITKEGLILNKKGKIQSAKKVKTAKKIWKMDPFLKRDFANNKYPNFYDENGNLNPGWERDPVTKRLKWVLPKLVPKTRTQKEKFEAKLARQAKHTERRHSADSLKKKTDAKKMARPLPVKKIVEEMKKDKKMEAELSKMMDKLSL